MAPTEASSGVANLVASIKQHKKFKQLASYSVQCLCKVLTPPHIGWERNLTDAFEAGALEAITDVLQRHSGDSDILKASTQCFAAMATNPRYAAALVESGAMMGMLESVMRNPDAPEGVTETLQLLEAIATHNPEALLMGGGADAATRVIQGAPGRLHITAACARTLEKLNKVPGGAHALLECDAVRVAMELVLMRAEGEGSNSESIVEAALRLLDRTCRTPEYADYIRNELNGMQVLSTSLETNRSNEKLCKIGGRLLSKLASSSVPELIARLTNPATPSTEREFLAGLLANLALEEENAEKIVAHGGIPALLSCFGASSKRTVEACSLAIERLAANEDHAVALIEYGAVATLVAALNAYIHETGVAAAIVPTLGCLAAIDAGIVDAAGGVEAVIAALRAHPEAEALAKEGIAFCEALGPAEFDMGRLVALGAIEAIAGALRAHPAHAEMALHGLRALIYTSFNEATVGAIAAAGGLDICLANAAYEDKLELVLAALYLVTSLALLPSAKEALLRMGGVDLLLAAVANYAAEEEMQEVAAELLTTIVDAAGVASMVAQLAAALEAALRSKSKADLTKLKQQTLRLVALAAQPEFAEIIMKGQGVGVLVRALESVSATVGLPEVEPVLTACNDALNALAMGVEELPELRGALARSGAVRGVITAIKAHPKLVRHVQSGVHFLETFAVEPEVADVIIEAGAVEAVVAALRANTNHVDVVTSSTNTLLQLAMTDKGALDVAKRGGTRQIIATVHANVGTPGFATAMEQALALLMRVALLNEGADLLNKQGGVDAVIAASEAVAKLYEGPQAEAIKAAAAKVLARLLTEQDVISTVEQLAELASSARRGRVPSGEAMKPVLMKLSHLAAVPRYAGLIVKRSGDLYLGEVIAAVLGKDDAALKGEMLPLAFRALASLSRSASLSDAPGAAGLTAQAIHAQYALAECLEVIANLAAHSEPVAAALLSDGTTLPMVLEVLKANLRSPAVSAACFNALAALAAHPSTAPLVAASDALRIVGGWVDDNIDDASREAIEAALRTLAAMAQSPAHAPSILAGNTLELVKAVLTKSCIESETSAPEVLGACVSVLTTLGSIGPSAVSTINASGALRRVLRAVISHPDYINSEATVLQVLELFRLFGWVPDVRAELMAIGAQELIVACMNAHGTSEAVLRAGAAALGALGAGEEAGRIALAEVQRLAAALEAAPEVTEELVRALGDAVQRLGNFLMIEGVVTNATAPNIMSVLSNAIALLAESELAGPATLAAGITSIGRLVELGGPVLEGSLPEAVEMVLDVLALNSSEPDVIAAAVHTLGVISSSFAGLMAVTSLGGLEVINDAARQHPNNQRLQSIVELTLARINEAMERHAEAMLMNGGDPAAIARILNALLAANAHNPGALAALLAKWAAMAGGEGALYDIMAHQRGNPDLMNAVLAALAAQRALLPPGVRPEGNGRRVFGLTQALQAALVAQGALGPNSDLRAKMGALHLAENTLGLLGGLDMRGDGAHALCTNGGLEALMQLLAANIDDEETVARVLAIVKGIMLFASPAAGASMAAPAHMGTIVGTLRLYLEVPGIVVDALDTMGFTARTTGPAASGIDRDGLRAVTAVSNAPVHDGNGEVKAAVGRLEAIMRVKFSDGEASARALMAALHGACAGLHGVGSTQEVPAEGGRSYFFDPTTGATTWDTPPSFPALKASIATLKDAATRQAEEVIPTIQDDILAALIGGLSAHARSPAVAEGIASSLANLAINDANVAAIARLGGVAAAMQALQVQPDNVALLTPLLVLLERMSRDEEQKAALAAAGGIDALLQIVLAKHGATNEEVALKALSTIANLACNSAPNIEALMAKGVVPAILAITRAWPKQARILENACCALSNLMYGSDDNKRTIGTSAGPEVVRIVAGLNGDAALLKMALRALGNLSFCDDNIRPLVERLHATRAIVAAMRAHAKDTEVLQLCMEVLGNLALLEEEPLEVDEDGEVLNPRDSIAEIILKEAGCGEVISTIKRFSKHPVVLGAALDCLANVASDPDVTEIMARKQGLVGLVVDTVQSSDFDATVVAHAIPLLAAMTYSRACTPLVVAGNGIAVLLSAMEQHGGNTEILLAAQQVLTNMAALPEVRIAVRNMEGVRTILALLEAHTDNKSYVEETLKTLIRLCADDALSSTIAETGMHILTRVIETHAGDPELLTVAFRLLGHLAFVESNLIIIVQHNGIVRVMSAITEHPDYQPLIVRSIQTLDNIAMANKENAAIVIDEGGKELIETIMSTYADDAEIQRYGRSALLSMSALENLSRSAEITKRAALTMKKGPKPEAAPKEKDPLAEYRHVLSAGKIMKVWTKGAPRTEHVVVSPDWRSVVWQDVKSHKKQGALDLRTVVAIRAGTGEGHKKALMTAKPVDPDCAFSIAGERMSLDLEANNPKERGIWVEALTKLLHVARTTPHLL